jgi:protease-4
MVRWVVCALALSLTGCFNGLLLKPTYVGGPLDETVIIEPDHWLCRDKVVLIDVEGLLLNARSSSLFGDGENPVSLFRERLDAAATDCHVKAVILRINSPGGGVTASDIMYQDLCNFRQETHKPVVACLMDVAASGGYYVAMGCDRVYAHPTTVTGSIGVIMSLYNASRLCDMLGIKSDPIKSGANKDLGNPARPMSPQERAILQSMVLSFYDQFVHVVACSRKLPEERVRALADGRVYTGLEAHKLGLVDQVGYLEDAMQAALEMAGLKDAALVAYDRDGGYRGSIYAAAPFLGGRMSIPSQITVKLDVPGLAGLTGPGGAGFMYLWEPGVQR